MNQQNDNSPAPNVELPRCPHTRRGGGNDYLACLDCGLEWDYRHGGEPNERNKKPPAALGFVVTREDGDVLIKDEDDSEWTSGVVWARSAPETVVTMLADLWYAAVELRQQLETVRSAVLAEAERAHRWIPVSEKLPEQADQVQVYSPSRGVEAAYYRPLEQIWVTVETYGFDSEARQIYDASHWKPLDEPPTVAADLLAGMRR
jgi:hypothetical protein